MLKPKVKLLALITLLTVTTIGLAGEDDWFKYLGDNKPYKAPPKNISSAEAMPPLPLPATPLRRTERKKPPQPNYLFGKVIWGQAATFKLESGQSLEVADWSLCPTDLDRIMDNVRKLNLNYHWQNVSLGEFSYSPLQVPALIISGTRTARIGEPQIRSLREYILNGGSVIFDSIAGSPYFYSSARKLTESILPECQIREIPQDHPIFHIITDINSIDIPKNKDIKRPQLEGVYIGSRLGVIISRHGLGCGWNNNTAPLQQLPEASYYSSSSATAIGLNLAAYIVGYAQAGFIEGRPEMHALTDQQTPTDEFIFAQIKHSGNWNVHPNAATAMLMKIRKNTSIRVNLKRQIIDLEKDNLRVFPFLYLTGMADFSFNNKEISALQDYLAKGGFLMINNGMGMKEFNYAVNRELKKVAPNSSFKAIPENHQLYNSFYQIDNLSFSPIVEASPGSVNRREPLNGINIDGQLKILYSPIDLEAGWLDVEYPLIKGFSRESSRQLGVNIITYIMTN